MPRGESIYTNRHRKTSEEIIDCHKCKDIAIQNISSLEKSKKERRDKVCNHKREEWKNSRFESLEENVRTGANERQKE